jgi:hypothetical protein
MGLLDRLRGGRRESSVSTRHEATAVSVSLLGGQDDLEVVGELAYQDALWRLSGGTLGDRIRRQIVAVLVPEPTNLYDANAIAVQIDGKNRPSPRPWPTARNGSTRQPVPAAWPSQPTPNYAVDTHTRRSSPCAPANQSLSATLGASKRLQAGTRNSPKGSPGSAT